MAKYEIEIWDKSGKPIADIRPICSNVQWSKTLNGSESLGFTLDLKRFENILEAVGYKNDPFGFMDVGRCDIRLKRNGKYILGTNIYRFEYTSSFNSVTMRVECVGYLNFYKTQYISGQYHNVKQEEIMWDVINKCNQKTGGDFGIRQGTHTGETTRRDRKYERKEVANLIQQMSEVIGGCDFEFTPDKKFNTYEAKGSYLPSIRLEYPGNIQSFNFSRTLDKVANYIYGVGSGNGDSAVQSWAEDTDSENYLYRREMVAIWNSISEQETLDEHTDAAVKAAKDIIELPNITLRDNVLDLSEIDVGDTVIVKLDGALSLAHINGDYRIQTISCNVDENDSEEATLSFDNYNIDDIINKQESTEDSIDG